MTPHEANRLAMACRMVDAFEGHCDALGARPELRAVVASTIGNKFWRELAVSMGERHVPSDRTITLAVRSVERLHDTSDPFADLPGAA